MEEILAALEAQEAELDALICPVDDAAWMKPSRCEGWAVSDVMLHLAQTNEMAIGSLTGTFDATLRRLTEGLRPSSDIDDGAGLMVDKERGAPSSVLYGRWRAGVDDLMALFWKANERDRVHWVAGALSIYTLATTRLAETWIHTGDVASAVGVTLRPPERLEHIVRLAWRTLPYAFMRAGREMVGTVDFDLIGTAGHTWRFEHAEPSATVVRGTAADLCAVAGQRAKASETSLTAEGPDAEDVLDLVRTFA